MSAPFGMLKPGYRAREEENVFMHILGRWDSVGLRVHAYYPLKPHLFV